MNDEYEQIISLFSLSNKEKEDRLDEIFRLSIAFIEKYKYIQEEGSEREKEDIGTKLEKLRIKIAEEAKKSRDKIGLSESEVRELAKDKNNFTDQQWNILQETGSSIEGEQSSMKSNRKKSIKKGKSAVSKNKKRVKRSSWIKS